MPIFEYACASCGHEFEELIFGSEQPRCPACESDRAEKKLSMFSARGSRTPERAPATPSAMPPGACGSCGDPRGPGSCSN